MRLVRRQRRRRVHGDLDIDLGNISEHRDELSEVPQVAEEPDDDRVSHASGDDPPSGGGTASERRGSRAQAGGVLAVRA